jgi:hypothetical protein
MCAGGACRFKTGHSCRPARLAAILLVALVAPPGGAEEPTPVVSRLHTLSIHVRSPTVHDALHALLAGTLKLPRTYDPVAYGQRKYVAVWTGNIALEPCGPYPPETYLSLDFEAMFYGLTFAPWESASASAAALDARGIGHAPPTDTVRVEDEDLSAPNVYVGIGWGLDEDRLASARAAFESRRGGPLGVSRVQEIRVGVSDETNFQKWVAFLEPHERLGERAFRVADGPVLRFVEDDVKEVLGITLKVRSLASAVAFLEGEHLLGEVTNGTAELDRARTHGLRIVLRE